VYQTNLLRSSRDILARLQIGTATFPAPYLVAMFYAHR
jgi:hypothetical protein